MHRGFQQVEPVEKAVEYVENSCGYLSAQLWKEDNYVNFCSVFPFCVK